MLDAWFQNLCRTPGILTFRRTDTSAGARKHMRSDVMCLVVCLIRFYSCSDENGGHGDVAPYSVIFDSRESMQPYFIVLDSTKFLSHWGFQVIKQIFDINSSIVHSFLATGYHFFHDFAATQPAYFPFNFSIKELAFDYDGPLIILFKADNFLFCLASDQGLR